MKAEEIKPGDILYDVERKMLVKVARVDENGVVKYSVYTDMQRIFKTVPPPYRVGIRTADAYIPATDEQRKYMERKLAVCEYVNLPKDNRMEVLAYIIADLKAENIELTQRVHQLMDDYNDVVHLLNGTEKRKEEVQTKQTDDEMQQLRAHCDKLEVEYNDLMTCLISVSSFLRDKKLYVANGALFFYKSAVVSSQCCKRCDFYLSTLKDVGVICRRRLSEATVIFSVHD